MKKARLFLAAIVVLGIAGGMFAFKAKSISTKTYFVTNTTDVKPTLSVPNAYTTTTGMSKVYFTTTTTAFATNYAFVTSDVE